MIQLHPNTTYKIRYMDGNVHKEGDIAYFKTLDVVPEAKHLIRVKDLATGKIVDLIDILAHPWDDLTEHTDGVQGLNTPGTLLKAIIPFLIATTRFWVRTAPAV